MFQGKLQKLSLMDSTQKRQELAEYQRNLTWLRKFRTGAWCLSDALAESGASEREMRMFRSRFSHVLGLNFSCNGCFTGLQFGQWYRCLQCTDRDFCTTCVTSKHQCSCIQNICSSHADGVWVSRNICRVQMLL